mgnify:CR=1 FL=1
MMNRKHKWKIIKHSFDAFQILEITDLRLKNVNTHDLFFDFLMNLPVKGNYYSVSQFFSPSQSKYDEYDQVLLELKYNKPSKYGITSRFDTVDKINDFKNNFVIHVLGKNLDNSLLNILHFSGATLSNTIYSFQEDCEEWLYKITGWNKQFLDVFWLKSNINSLIDLATQLNLLLWTADGHINIVAKDARELELYLEQLHEIANNYSVSLEI